MEKEKSVGAIIFRIDEKETKYLLLYKKASGHYREAWDFPRGNTEPNETEEETAKREAREETGLEIVNLVRKFRERIEFFYRREGKPIHKTIIFLLAEAKQKEIRISHEHNDYRWCDYEEAISLLTHKTSKDILKKANEFLSESFKQRRLV